MKNIRTILGILMITFINISIFFSGEALFANTIPLHDSKKGFNILPSEGDEYRIIESPDSFVFKIIAEGIRWAGILAIIAVTYGGIMYIISYGQDEKLSKAKNIILYGLLGVIVAGGAYMIIEIVNSLSIG